MPTQRRKPAKKPAPTVAAPPKPHPAGWVKKKHSNRVLIVLCVAIAIVVVVAVVASLQKNGLT